MDVSHQCFLEVLRGKHPLMQRTNPDQEGKGEIMEVQAFGLHKQCSIRGGNNPFFYSKSKCLTLLWLCLFS